MSSANEVELTAHGCSSNDDKGESQATPTNVKIEPSKENVKPVPVKTLFFKYATKKEIAFLILGFFCTFMPLRFTDSCDSVRSTDTALPHFLWRITR